MNPQSGFAQERSLPANHHMRSHFSSSNPGMAVADPPKHKPRHQALKKKYRATKTGSHAQTLKGSVFEMQSMAKDVALEKQRAEAKKRLQQKKLQGATTTPQASQHGGSHVAFGSARDRSGAPLKAANDPKKDIPISNPRGRRTSLSTCTPIMQPSCDYGCHCNSNSSMKRQLHAGCANCDPGRSLSCSAAMGHTACEDGNPNVVTVVSGSVKITIQQNSQQCVYNMGAVAAKSQRPTTAQIEDLTDSNPSTTASETPSDDTASEAEGGITPSEATTSDPREVDHVSTSSVTAGCNVPAVGDNDTSTGVDTAMAIVYKSPTILSRHSSRWNSGDEHLSASELIHGAHQRARKTGGGGGDDVPHSHSDRVTKSGKAATFNLITANNPAHRHYNAANLIHQTYLGDDMMNNEHHHKVVASPTRRFQPLSSMDELIRKSMTQSAVGASSSSIGRPADSLQASVKAKNDSTAFQSFLQ